jgi:putrescine aminotransferase
MPTLAYTNTFSGMSNSPTIELAHFLAGYAYEGLNTTFFAMGRTESNERAFKTTGYYWKSVGKPAKFKVIARED